MTYHNDYTTSILLNLNIFNSSPHVKHLMTESMNKIIQFWNVLVHSHRRTYFKEVQTSQYLRVYQILEFSSFLCFPSLVITVISIFQKTLAPIYVTAINDHVHSTCKNFLHSLIYIIKQYTLNWSHLKSLLYNMKYKHVSRHRIDNLQVHMLP